MWVYMFIISSVLFLHAAAIERTGSLSAVHGCRGITLITPLNRTICVSCPLCKPGREPEAPCGSTVPIKGNDMKRILGCRRCRKGMTYSASFSKRPCKKCKICSPQEHEIRKCTRRSNTRCLSCLRGYYYSNDSNNTCLPCSKCCGDDQDKVIAACTSQSSSLHCSIESYRRCRVGVDQKTTFSLPTISTNQAKHIVLTYATTLGIKTYQSSHKFVNVNKQNERTSSEKTFKFKFIVTLIVLLVLIFLALGTFIWLRKFRTKSVLCVRKLSSKKRLAVITKSVQSDDVDEWAQRDPKSGTYYFKRSDITIWYDKTSRFDGFKDFVVEVANSVQSFLAILDPDQVFLSPVFMFYSQGTQFMNSVQISLPHSANIDASNNWIIMVLVCDTREQKKPLKWKKFEGEIEINWNHVRFSTNTLLSYVVVGKPVQFAKKRMQLVLYSMQEMISDQLEMVLYLVDESVSSLQRVSKENKAKDWKMISTKYAAFVECFSPVNISVTVHGLEEPWTLLHVKPEVMSNKVLVDSYSEIPSFQVTFRRLNRSAQIFSCDFHVDVGGEKKIIIPAATFLPEELPFSNCEIRNEDPTVFDKKFLLRDIPYDIKYQLWRKLDIPAKDRGQWRDVGRHFLISEDGLRECSLEYATLDGSPSRKLFEMILHKDVRPELTVGEFAKVLEDLDRSDVVAVLSKAKMADLAIG